MASGALPALASPPANPAGAGWAPAEALAVGGLNSQSVGFHAGQPAVQDAAAMPRHAEKRTIVDVTTFGADPTGKVDSAKAVNDAIEHARGLGRPTTIDFPCGSYAMYPENAPKRELYVSNTVGA